MAYYPLCNRAAPSRQCLVCECMEHPKARIVDTGAPWLCETCKLALQKLIAGGKNG